MLILLTGGAGLIGTEVRRILEIHGHETISFDISDGFSDIGEIPRLRTAMAGCDGVIHLAAISRVAWGESEPALCHLVNVQGTENVLSAALDQPVRPWVVFASSREVYGDPDTMPVPETAPLKPVNHYGRSKAAGEALVSVARAAGLRTATLRLSSVYGAENDHPDRAVPALLWRALQGEELRLSGTDTFFDFVHVEDTARGIVAAVERLATGSQLPPTVHLATGVQTSLGALADMAISVAGSASNLVILPARSFDVKGFCGDPSIARAVLGWQSQITLHEGLHRLCELLKARGRALDPVGMPMAHWPKAG